jgi:hypothetical protein
MGDSLGVCCDDSLNNAWAQVQALEALCVLNRNCVARKI